MGKAEILMASYRFCRPDDISLLIQAINNCYSVHFPQNSLENIPWDLLRFKQAMHELDLWPGYCMLAFHDNQPIAILICAKREKTVHILKLATHPTQLRQGHASHLLNSLNKKLAILAPGTTMEVIIPNNRDDLRQFFEAQNYKVANHYADFELVRGDSLSDTSIVQPVTVEDLCGLPFFQSAKEISWERAPRTLRQRLRDIQGLAIPTVDGWIAYLLFINKERTEIVGLGCENERNPEVLYSMLLNLLKQNTQRPIWISKVCKQEIPYALLEKFGFKKGLEYSLYKI